MLRYFMYAALMCSSINAYAGDKNDALTVYGRANIGLLYSDIADQDDTEVKSYSSRFGLKGRQSLDNNLEVFYQFEWGVDLAGFDEDNSISDRNQIVGLRSDFGTVMLGRYDTFLKDSQGAVDQFKDYTADLKYLFKGEVRADNSLTYYSPAYKGFKLGFTYVFSDEDSVDDGQSFGLIYGDEKLKKSNVYAALAFDNEVAGFDIVQFSFATKVNDFKLGFAAQDYQSVDGIISAQGVLVSAAKRYGAWVPKVQYQVIKDDERDHSISIGSDYYLGDNTRLFAFYTARNRDIQQQITEDYLSIGVRHDFSW